VRVAALGDVHGNLHALDAVLADIGRRRVQGVWWLGDLVGYGAFPGQVVERLRARGDPAVLGNYDRKVLDYPARAAAWAGKKRPEKLLAFRWAHAQLSRAARAFLERLPERLALEQAGLRIALAHRGPEPFEFVGPALDARELGLLLDWAGADLLLLGHTHRPFAAEVGGRWVVNPGAVGRPEGGDPRACYALLELGSRGRVRVEHVRVPYPVEAAARAILDAGLPPAFADMLRCGAPLDALEPAPVAAQGALAEASQALARRLVPAELGHARQVARLALALFDELGGLHRLPAQTRAWLACAAWLHDLGWVEGASGHHKASQRLILADRSLPLGGAERALVACVARYHRKAMPSRRHAEYAALGRERRRWVRLLGGMLRLADGLDRGHAGAVHGLRCRIGPGRVRVSCQVAGLGAGERAAARDKADLLRVALGREVVLSFEALERGGLHGRQGA